MKFHSKKHLLRPALGLAMLVLAFGCSNKLVLPPVQNQLPEVRLTSAPIDTSGRYYYSYTVDWVGFDPDGPVDHYLYTIDPQDIHPAQQLVRVSEGSRDIASGLPSPLLRASSAGAVGALGLDQRRDDTGAVHRSDAGPELRVRRHRIRRRRRLFPVVRLQLQHDQA